MGPIGFCFAESPSEDKTFSRFQKGGLPSLKRKVQTPFLKHNKMERIKWTPLGFASLSPFRGEKYYGMIWYNFFYTIGYMRCILLW